MTEEGEENPFFNCIIQQNRCLLLWDDYGLFCAKKRIDDRL